MEYEHEAVLTTDWNRIKNLADFYRQWPQFSCDVGMRTIADIMAKPSCDGGVRDLDDITGFAGYYEPSGWYVTALEDAGEMSPVDLFCVT